ncbi:hypothetical protein ACVW0I_005966 [Bradyrhizobium sp. LM6.11]
MDLHFHHLGMACRNIEAELPELAIAGYSPEGPVFEDPIQQVRIQFVSGGGPRLELIEPAGAQSPVEGILKRGGKFYHLAYEVSQLDDAIACFTAAAVFSRIVTRARGRVRHAAYSFSLVRDAHARRTHRGEGRA